MDSFDEAFRSPSLESSSRGEGLFHLVAFLWDSDVLNESWNEIISKIDTFPF